MSYDEVTKAFNKLKDYEQGFDSCFITELRECCSLTTFNEKTYNASVGSKNAPKRSKGVEKPRRRFIKLSERAE